MITSRSRWQLHSFNEACAVQVFGVPQTPNDGTCSPPFIQIAPKGAPAVESVPYVKDFTFPWPTVTGHLSQSFCSYFSPRNCSRLPHPIFHCWSFLDSTHWLHTSLQPSPALWMEGCSILKHLWNENRIKVLAVYERISQYPDIVKGS